MYQTKSLDLSAGLEQGGSESICEWHKSKVEISNTDAVEYISGQRWIATDYID